MHFLFGGAAVAAADAAIAAAAVAVAAAAAAVVAVVSKELNFNHVTLASSLARDN